MLALACILMAGWVRSHWFLDGFGFHPSRGSVAAIVSIRGRAIGFLMQGLSDYVPSADSFCGSRKLNDSDIFRSFYTFDTPWHWHWSLAGLEIGKLNGLGVVSDQTMVIIPYWLIVIPLTLLSAYLLLTKPRGAEAPVAQPDGPTNSLTA